MYRIVPTNSVERAARHVDLRAVMEILYGTHRGLADYRRLVAQCSRELDCSPAFIRRQVGHLERLGMLAVRDAGSEAATVEGNNYFLRYTALGS